MPKLPNFWLSQKVKGQNLEEQTIGEVSRILSNTLFWPWKPYCPAFEASNIEDIEDEAEDDLAVSKPELEAELSDLCKFEGAGEFWGNILIGLLGLNVEAGTKSGGG